MRHNHEEIVSLYESGLTTREVALKYGCSKSCVSRVVKACNKSRSKDTRSHVLAARAKTCDDFTQNFRDYLDGLLISDGHLKKPSKNTKTSCYQQTSVCLEWLLSIKDNFNKFQIETNISPEKRNPQSYILCTQRYRQFYDEYERWYGEEKRVPKDLNLKSKALLKNWIYGDGTLVGSSKTTLRLCTDSFSIFDLDWLKSQFAGFGYRFNYVNMGKSKAGETKTRLSLCKNNGLFEFFDMVGAPDICSLSYKWPRKK